jgi:hypothetical protein
MTRLQVAAELHQLAASICHRVYNRDDAIDEIARELETSAHEFAAQQVLTIREPRGPSTRPTR